jgi:hypothetical protein
MIKFMRMASPYFNLYCPVVMAMIMLLMAGIAQIRADTSYSNPVPPAGYPDRNQPSAHGSGSARPAANGTAALADRRNAL